ncbi:MAG: hypothetical protein WKG07_46215 [Hymenobacter sp.]
MIRDATGVITFESNGVVDRWSAAKGFPRVVSPGFRDIRGYQAMYRDFRELDPGPDVSRR